MCLALTSLRSSEGLHALILEGSVDCDYVRRLAAARLCLSPKGGQPCLDCTQCRKVMQDTHPDVAVLDLGPGAEIKTDMIRNMRTDAFIRPFEAETKAYIVFRAENMNSHAQNALLKLLEEPPPYAVFYLQTLNSQSLLPTVRSRCALLRVTGNSYREEENPEALARGKDLYSAFSKRDELALAKALLPLEKLPRKEFVSSLEAFCNNLRQRLGAGLPVRTAANAIEETMAIIDAINSNAAQPLCCAALCIKLASL